MDGGHALVIKGKDSRACDIFYRSRAKWRLPPPVDQKIGQAQVAAARTLSKAALLQTYEPSFPVPVVGLYVFERLRFDVDRALIRVNRFTRLCARIMGARGFPLLAGVVVQRF